MTSRPACPRGSSKRRSTRRTTETWSTERLLDGLGGLPRRRGVARLRELLAGATVTLTTTELERLFVPLARGAGLPDPLTQAWLDGHRVDFYWPHLDLVVEADSLRYHRTAFKQAEDKRRDNDHALAGRSTLRFTHGQIVGEPDYVRATLTRTCQRLRPRERKRDR